MSLPEKLKCSIYICCLDRNKKTKIELFFAKDYFSITFLEPLKEENLKEIKDIFSPFFSKNNRVIKISYIYIKSIYVDNSKLLKFTLHNPISTSIITIIFNHFKYKKSLIFTDANIPISMLPSIALDINQKIINLIEKKINDFITLIRLLYQFTSTERKYDQIIDNLFINAFTFGKNYYDKCCKELYFNEKRNKKIMSEETTKKINKFINQMKIENESNTKTNIMEQIRKANKSSSSIEEEDEEKSKTKNMKLIDSILTNNGTEYSEFKPSILSALNIDLNNKRDLFQNYDKFKKYLPEIKIRTSYFSEITINLIFKIFNVDRKDLDNKYNYINKSAIGLRIDLNINRLKTSTMYADSQMNYNLNTIYNDKNINLKKKNSFEKINNNMKKYYSDEKYINEDQNEEKNINEFFEFSKKFHSFAPNNSVQNIVDNTSQIIHRKFFELLFKHFFSDIIDIETEKNKTLGSEPFHLILKVIKRLKKIIFTNKNMNYFNEYLFLLEQ